MSSPSYSVTCVNFSPNGRLLVAGMSITAPDGETSLGNNIKIWNPCTGELLHVLSGHSQSSVMSIAFSPDGKTLASGGFDGKIKLWDVSTWTVNHIIEEHFRGVCALAFSPDGKTLASGSSDSIIKLWNPYTGMRLQRLTAHTGSVNSLAFSANGQTLVSGSSDGTIKIWRCD
ncbi:MAG: WD40 repeat domain-containing protein [Rhizonema sp. NSF051]|nr:WD40 repeat domain-containing protein [Rhizonema sp. NSF051]